jgi:hypothetical protein
MVFWVPKSKRIVKIELAKMWIKIKDIQDGIERAFFIKSESGTRISNVLP